MYSEPHNVFSTAREYDTETGLYYYRLRYYDPLVGRFLQEDPVGYLLGPNLYTYVNNNPVNWIDPSGLYDMWGPGDPGPDQYGHGGKYNPAPFNWKDAKTGAAKGFIGGVIGGYMRTGTPHGAAIGGIAGTVVGFISGGTGMSKTISEAASGSINGLSGTIGGAGKGVVKDYLGNNNWPSVETGFFAGAIGGFIGGSIRGFMEGGFVDAFIQGTLGAWAGAFVGIATGGLSEAIDDLSGKER